MHLHRITILVNIVLMGSVVKICRWWALHCRKAVAATGVVCTETSLVASIL